LCCAVLPGSGQPSHRAAENAEGVRRFFELTVPASLARNRDQTRQINGRCLFDVGDESSGAGQWIVDFTTDPPTVVASHAAETDCQIRLTAGDLLEVIDDPPTAQVLAWQGKLRVGGDQALMSRVTDLLFPWSNEHSRVSAGYYASLSRLIPDPRFTFMNYGYADDSDDFSGLSEADRTWRYAINMIRRTLDGTQIGGARVLDVGCGRGGAASYIARYLDPLSVTGLDASSDSIRFCRDRHPHPSLTFVHASAENIPVEDASFDVVLNVESSHCYPNRGRFLSEVERVLKPGGAFCYADVFRPTDLDDTHRLLSEIPNLHVLRMGDITAQVVRAIDLNRDSFAELLLSATDSKLRNMSLIANLVHTVNVQMYESFAAEQVQYYAWRIEKAGA
jgi:ubiquinone/menaquinone biosynthesis C-methylase UbiE